MEHVSVLKNEVLEAMNLQEGDVVVDCTLGLGGHAKEILKRIGNKGRLIGFEKDERNLVEAQENLKDYDEQINCFPESFRYLKDRLIGLGLDKVDSILFDLGISSPHVDEAERGFSFIKDGPLDMRFDQKQNISAYDVVNFYSEADLKNVLYKYAEEKYAPKISRSILERRKEKLFESTLELAEFLEEIMPKKRSKRGKSSHPATKTFQALRIEVNSELKEVAETLPQAVEMLKMGGVVAVITFHSIEDRLVKKFFKTLERPPVEDPEEALYRTTGDPIVEKLFRKPIIPTKEELEANPRSRSAKLRVYKKIKNYIQK